MDKMDKNGMDFKEINIERMKALFPECITDGKIDFDKLKVLLGEEVDSSNEKYSFNWIGKNASIKNAITPSTATLIPCKEKSKNWDTTENLYIEGDNLEVLKTLSKTYHGQIKMIYIDPPYNTGKDFVYNDNFHDNSKDYIENTEQAYRANPETSGKYHTNWLNMMYPRLKIAKDLLKEDGAIFISIDDNEQSNLKKMCDEIFGDENFVACIMVKGNPRGRQSSSYIAQVHDYLLIYKKSDELELQGFVISEEEKKKRFNKKDEYGESYEEWELRKRGADSRREDCPNLWFPIFYDEILGSISLDKDERHTIEIVPKLSDGTDGRWRWSRQKVNDEKDRLYVRKNNKGIYNIYERKKIDEKSKQLAPTIWDYADVNTELGTKLVKTLFDNKAYFDFPKPIGLLNRIISLFEDNDFTVLDFFSGSATTAHSVMSMNSLDGGKRKFILVQLPEVCETDSIAQKDGYNSICEIGEDRIRRAGAKIQEAMKLNGLTVSMLANGVKNKKEIKDDEGETVAQLSMTGLFDTPENVEEVNEEMANNIDVGFKVFKLDSTCIKPWDSTVKYDESNLFELMDIIKEGRSNLDVAYEIMLKYGVFNMPLEEKVVNGKTIYSVGGGYMIISLNDEITSDDVKAIAELKPKAVVFKESGFKDDSAKMNADYTFKRLGIDNVKCI